MTLQTGPARPQLKQRVVSDPTDPRPSVEIRYRAARRHSGFVRVFKYALPIVSLLAIAAFVAYYYFIPSFPDGLTFGSIDVTHNAVVMQSPHVSGYTNDGRAYELKADRAEQSLQNTKLVTLQKIGATIGLENDGTAKVVATEGTYQSDQQRLTLDKDITLSTSTGISGKLQSADINLKAGTMSSDHPIDFSGQGSRIQANSVEVLERGKRVLFRNGVKVTYATPPESPPTTPPTGSPSVTP